SNVRTVKGHRIHVKEWGLTRKYAGQFSQPERVDQEKSFDFDKGECLIYLIKMDSEATSNNDIHNVYGDGKKCIQTIVAPCLEELGRNLTLGLVYKVKGQIVRDDACGTSWEFNPLLSKLSTRSEHLRVSGMGRVVSVTLALAIVENEHQHDEILVNHQPSELASLIQIRLIIRKHESQSINLLTIDTGATICFSGTFIGEETDSAIIRLLPYE
ncbi:hypothetical protein PGTUg99_007230, partial [Puccinia graminis f. sp. tritici]